MKRIFVSDTKFLTFSAKPINSLLSVIIIEALPRQRRIPSDLSAKGLAAFSRSIIYDQTNSTSPIRMRSWISSFASVSSRILGWL